MTCPSTRRSMIRLTAIYLVAACVYALTYAHPAWAANTPRTARSGTGGAGTHETLFRCRDEHGQVRFGDTMPVECEGQDTEVLSEHGNIIRTIDGVRTSEAKAARKSADEAEQKAKADAEMRDKMLIDTYLSVSDIETLRDQRLDLVQSQLLIDQQTLKALNDREKAALNQVKLFRPFNTAANARGIPDNLVGDMVSIANNLRITQERIDSKKAEINDLQARFTADVARFKQLKGIK